MMKVYAIRVCDGIVKIGIAKDAQQRLNWLQKEISKWRPDISLTLLHVENVECPWSMSRFGDPSSRFQDRLRAEDVERAAHKDLAAKRLPREWFTANKLLYARYLGETEWFKATDTEAICAVKAGVIQPLSPPYFSHAAQILRQSWCVPAFYRFEDLFEGTLTTFLIERETT